MFLIIPLILIASSAGTIGWIVWPKIKEIKSKENLPEIKEGFWHLIFPELFKFTSLVQSKFIVFKHNAAVDYEKFLRRIKILSLRTHNLTNKLLEKKQKSAAKPEFKEISGSSNGQTINAYFKTKENNLIAEIAKNPKDKNLYKALGVLYLDNQMFDDAKEVFDVILELDPNDLEVKEKLEKLIS